MKKTNTFCKVISLALIFSFVCTSSVYSLDFRSTLRPPMASGQAVHGTAGPEKLASEETYGLYGKIDIFAGIDPNAEIGDAEIFRAVKKKIEALSGKGKISLILNKNHRSATSVRMDGRGNIYIHVRPDAKVKDLKKVLKRNIWANEILIASQFSDDVASVYAVLHKIMDRSYREKMARGSQLDCSSECKRILSVPQEKIEEWRDLRMLTPDVSGKLERIHSGRERIESFVTSVAAQNSQQLASSDTVRGAAEGVITYNQHITLREWLERNNAQNPNTIRRALEEKLGVDGIIDIFGVSGMANETGHKGHYAIRDRVIYIDADILNGENGELYLEHEVFELIKIIKFGFGKFGNGKARRLGNARTQNNLLSLISWLRKSYKAIPVADRIHILAQLVSWLDEEGNIKEVQKTLTAIHKSAPRLPNESEEVVADVVLPRWWWNNGFQDFIWKLMRYSTQSTQPLTFYLENITDYSRHGVIERDGEALAYVPEAPLEKFDKAATKTLKNKNWVITIPALNPELSVEEVRTKIEAVLIKDADLGEYQRFVRGAASQGRVTPGMYIADIRAVRDALPWITGKRSLTELGEREVLYLRASCQRILWVGDTTLGQWKAANIISEDEVDLRREVLMHREKVEEFAASLSASGQQLASGNNVGKISDASGSAVASHGRIDILGGREVAAEIKKFLDSYPGESIRVNVNFQGHITCATLKNIERATSTIWTPLAVNLRREGRRLLGRAASGHFLIPADASSDEILDLLDDYFSERGMRLIRPESGRSLVGLDRRPPLSSDI